jgi:hypothetical protein
MRRRTAMAVAALCAVFALGGCGALPPGVDGDLTDGWPAMPQAKLAIPVVGACYAMLSSGVSAGDDTTTPCVTTHDLETAYVGLQERIGERGQLHRQRQGLWYEGTEVRPV